MANLSIGSDVPSVGSGSSVKGLSEDHANVLAGCVYLVCGMRSTLETWMRFGRAVPALLAAIPEPGRVTTSAILYAQQRSLGGFPF
jgi:hypothetical protein